MRWQCEIRGLTPMIHNCGMSGLDKRSEVSVEITAITDKATKLVPFTENATAPDAQVFTDGNRAYQVGQRIRYADLVANGAAGTVAVLDRSEPW